MIDQDKAKLQAEQARGEEFQRVFDGYVKPFIEEKRKVLFDAFQDVSVANVEQLKDIKLQLTAINSLESYFKEFITTGELAKIQLQKE